MKHLLTLSLLAILQMGWAQSEYCLDGTVWDASNCGCDGSRYRYANAFDDFSVTYDVPYGQNLSWDGTFEFQACPQGPGGTRLHRFGRAWRKRLVWSFGLVAVVAEHTEEEKEVVDVDAQTACEVRCGARRIAIRHRIPIERKKGHKV